MSVPGRYVYEWPRPSFTADVALLRPGAPPEILLIRRGHPPFEGMHALPGGFVDPEEAAIDAAARELLEETGVPAPPLIPFLTLDAPGRDPRGRTVTVVYLALDEGAAATAGDDAAEVGWFPLNAPPPLAFDHAVVVERILAWLGSGAVEPGLAALRARLTDG